MKRQELEHILRATGAITDENDMIVIGSQAILGTSEIPPTELTVSMGVDLYPERAPHKADLIDGSIGELSPFHNEFGYYAHGVGPGTAVVPVDWRNRAVPLEDANTRGVVGWCLAPVDLAISKLAAGRDKDIDYVRVLLRDKFIEAEATDKLLGRVDPAVREIIRSRLRRCVRAAL